MFLDSFTEIVPALITMLVRYLLYLLSFLSTGYYTGRCFAFSLFV